MERPTSTPMTTDYTTQGDPNQVSPSTPNLFMSTATEIEFVDTNTFFVPDGSDRCIHQIDNKVFHAGYLENGNNAYLLELPALEKMPGLARSTTPLVTGTQPTTSTSHQPDDLLPKQPAPKTVQYQPPSFKLTRPTAHLTMNERIQVHHNYISAVSCLEHKKDLINRLK